MEASISKIIEAAKMAAKNRGGVAYVSGGMVSAVIGRGGRPDHTVVFDSGAWVARRWSRGLGRYEQVNAGRIPLG